MKSAPSQLASSLATTKYFHPEVYTLVLKKHLPEQSEEGEVAKGESRILDWYPEASSFVNLLKFDASTNSKN